MISSLRLRIGLGGVFIREISIRGFAGILGRELDAFEAELPGRGGRTNEANGASSESSDESEVSSNLVFLTTVLPFANAARQDQQVECN